MTQQVWRCLATPSPTCVSTHACVGVRIRSQCGCCIICEMTHISFTTQTFTHVCVDCHIPHHRHPTDVSWRIMTLILHSNADLHCISITLTATVECVCFWDLYAASPAQDFNVQFCLLLSLSQGWYGCLFLNIWLLVVPVVSVCISAGTAVCFWHRLRQCCDVRSESARVFPHCCFRKS